MSGIINLTEIEEFQNLEFLAKQIVAGFITGLHKSPFHGFSVEFSEHRNYNAGESTKNIDWKLYGRSDKLFVKRYEEETNLRCQLVLDCSSSMYYPAPNSEKLKFSILAASAITQILKSQRDAVGLSVFDEELKTHIPAKSNTSHLKRIYAEMESLLNSTPTLQKTQLDKNLHLIAEAIPKRSMVVIFSDLMGQFEENEALFDALQHLKHNKHEVIIFHVMDKKSEFDFEFENRPYLFTDLETGQEVKVQPHDVKESYVARTQEKIKEIKLKCGQYGIEYVETDIVKQFKEVLLPWVVKRSKMT
ncbi:MAG: hypothetical protein ACJAZ3_001291 [Sphingobacteriales bacterium]|jgi:uncharacterized protein (DUF58 family)